MVYSYKYGFSGFAAKLTSSQAKRIGELPGVVRVMQNNFYKPHTSRSWDFLGLPKSSPNNILNQTNQGDGAIIGIIDSGIWGDSEAFNDHGLGPIPSRWKGVCKSEGNFGATKHCNRKIIGARWYIKGLMEEMKQNQTMFEKYNNVSALDDDGHGTHCASTAAGSYVNNVNYYDLNMGTVRGGAPLARLAIYKVLWNIDEKNSRGAAADILAAIDDAIKDRVDVLSASLANDKISAEVHEHSGLGLGSFHAVSHGIPVIAGAGNDGPDPYTIFNTSPWVINVAASNSDRDIVTPLTLGNNKTILGRGLFRRKSVFAPLIVFENITNCGREEVKSIANEVKGKVLMLFLKGEKAIVMSLGSLATTEVLALIVATAPSDKLIDFNQQAGIPLPFVSVNLDQGYQIWNYFQQCKSNNQDPMIKLGGLKLLEGKHNVALKVSMFSSRGPNPFAPDILKPDVAAPGVNILAAMIPSKGDNGFDVMSGTSMATPHITGIVALLKVAHPDWSPAAIKSALVTTAWNQDTYRSEIYSEGTEGKIADPFDFGGGIANPNGATDPGLVYDMDKKDYLTYLCSLGFSNDKVYNASKYFSIKNNEKFVPAGIVCPSGIIPSRLNLNLPSISIPNLNDSVTIRRRVTNVGNVNSVYKLVVKPPRYTVIEVTPHVLEFNSKTKEVSFEVKITSTLQETSKYNFGSLAWTDGKHFVRIPIAVRRQFAD